MAIVVRQHCKNFLGVGSALIPINFFYNETLEEIANSIIEDNKDAGHLEKIIVNKDCIRLLNNGNLIYELKLEQ